MLSDFCSLKDRYPARCLVASIMEEPSEAAWAELVERVLETGVDALGEEAGRRKRARARARRHTPLPPPYPSTFPASALPTGSTAWCPCRTSFPATQTSR